MQTHAEETAPGVDRPPADGAPPAPPRKRRHVVWLGVLCAIAIVTWLLLRHRNAAPPRGGPPPVTVVPATAQRADVPVYLDAIGTVTPLHTNLITSQVNGLVISVNFIEGQRVLRGAPLVDIDPRPFAATLLQAQGALQRDTQVLAQARMDVERYRTAWAKNAIAKQLLDDQEKLVLQAEGTVKNDQGLVKSAEVQLGFAHITAPISGRIGLRLVDPGNVVNPTTNTTLAVITQLQPISVVFTISEDDLTEVLEQTRAGAQLVVEALDRVKSKRLASGTLITVDNQIDTTTGTVKLRALFDNDHDELFPNQFVNTRLRVRTVSAATTVPSSAVQHNGKVSFVYVIKDAHAHLQNVKAGVVEGDRTQVEGIDPGTVVANSSFEKLQDGSPITIGSAVATSGPAGLGTSSP